MLPGIASRIEIELRGLQNENLKFGQKRFFIEVVDKHFRNSAFIGALIVSYSYIKNFYDDTDVLTWENLIKECGAKVMTENSVRALEIFNKKYLKKIIQWKGYFMNAFVNRASQIGLETPNHLVNINIRMIPSETIKSQDLILSMGKATFLEHFDLIKNMGTGTPVEFKAKFESIGDEWKPHHLHLIWINATDDFMKDKVNVTLFKGVNFDIQGHLKLKNEIEKIPDELNNNNTIINENNTYINEKEKEK